ncbi:site-specific DNA-methyltransferase [Pontibacter sp. SGAir0037]|uniref:DNA-methyltransferase n=1 Tax=Pontibacter sp. SGAir0037 TaxID=2571030 RepID=UPI0010CD475F|nr:site-specific DNA-methyltransferase [Pontibacter sp. SGAir0037]QCR22852.1 site-specific DNA-methyltransferase [Pontibacter sp. SGAir0037]
MDKVYYNSPDSNFQLYLGNCVDILPKINEKVDLVFADPPYFLSNDGFTIKAGKVASVNKGDWDKKENHLSTIQFTEQWLEAVRHVMKDSATIWVSCTMHNLFDVGSALQRLGFKTLNIVTWQKTNPPPNLSCRYFTHSTEHIIWARKHQNKAHYFNYELMKSINQGKQMKDVWTLPAVSKKETTCGKHPTQKSLSLLNRIILASSQEDDLVLDPFAGSSTTGIAANTHNRRYIGTDISPEFLNLSICRKKELDATRQQQSILISS